MFSQPSPRWLLVWAAQWRGLQQGRGPPRAHHRARRTHPQKHRYVRSVFWWIDWSNCCNALTCVLFREVLEGVLPKDRRVATHHKAEAVASLRCPHREVRVGPCSGERWSYDDDVVMIWEYDNDPIVPCHNMNRFDHFSVFSFLGLAGADVGLRPSREGDGHGVHTASLPSWRCLGVITTIIDTTADSTLMMTMTAMNFYSTKSYYRSPLTLQCGLFSSF